jgi:hypothetical protein
MVRASEASPAEAAVGPTVDVPAQGSGAPLNRSRLSRLREMFGTSRRAKPPFRWHIVYLSTFVIVLSTIAAIFSIRAHSKSTAMRPQLQGVARSAPASPSSSGPATAQENPFDRLSDSLDRAGVPRVVEQAVLTNTARVIASSGKLPEYRKGLPDATNREARLACGGDPVPESGRNLAEPVTGGHGVLSIDNGTANDAVVAVISNSRSVIRRFYVRAHSVATARSIPIGTYRLRFAFGNDFSLATHRFCSLLGAQEFDHRFVFDEAPEPGAVEYTIERITLHRVANGNAPAHRISPELVFGDSI